MVIPDEQIADGTLRFWRKRTKEDEQRFRRRYKLAELRRQVPDLASALYDQESIFVEACVCGTVQDIEEHGASLCRGWMKAIEAMGGL